MLALGMAPKAEEQGYFPEWITGGLAFVEQDIVAQLIDGNQWKRAFGLAFNAEPEPIGRSCPRAAYRPCALGGEPAFGVEEALLPDVPARDRHPAGRSGPHPGVVRAGMFSYPGASGSRHLAVRAG